MGFKRILHVENVPSWRKIIADVVQTLPNVELVSTGSPWHAEEELAKGDYDLALVDLHLHPEMNGDHVIATAFRQSPNTQISLVSGTLSDRARKSLQTFEPGVPFIPKDDFLDTPDLAREKVSWLLQNTFPRLKNSASLEAIAREEAAPRDVASLAAELDVLKPDIHLLRQSIGKDLPEPVRTKVLELTRLNGMYNDDTERMHSRLHDYKGQFAIAVSLTEQQRADHPAIYRNMTLMLYRLMSILTRSDKENMVSISQIFDKEITRLSRLYPDINFRVNEGGINNPAHIILSDAFDEVFRIMLSNAAEAYHKTKGRKDVDVYVTKTSPAYRTFLEVVINNRGRKLPKQLAKKSLELDDLVTNKETGTGFGLKRVIELGMKMGFEIGFMSEGSFTSATIRVDEDSYMIRKPSVSPSDNLRILVVDHRLGNYGHLRLADIGRNVDYVCSEKEFHDAAVLNAKDYALVAVHVSSGYLDNLKLMLDNNPLLHALIVTGDYDHRMAAEERFPKVPLRSKMPNEAILKRYIRAIS